MSEKSVGKIEAEAVKEINFQSNHLKPTLLHAIALAYSLYYFYKITQTKS